MDPWGPGGVRAPRKPNLYQLRGSSLHITYSPSGFDGKKSFIYHDPRQTLDFYGDEVRIAVAEFGTLVSVTLAPAVGPRSTDFTLVVPNVNLFGTTQAEIKTFGLMTIQEIGVGQTQLNTVEELSGVAALVEF
jgi:hypothetical protein